MRELPADLVAAVRRAREMEALAYATGGLHAQHRAIHATSALLLAACRLGWTQRELAKISGLNRQAVHARVAEARKLYGDETPALVFDAPVDRPPHPRRVLELPVDEREWLTRPEAAEYAGVHTFTIRNWFINGQLPHTQTETVPYLFLRADLARVLRAERYNARGIDYTALQQDWRQLNSGQDRWSAPSIRPTATFNPAEADLLLERASRNARRTVGAGHGPKGDERRTGYRE